LTRTRHTQGTLQSSSLAGADSGAPSRLDRWQWQQHVRGALSANCTSEASRLRTAAACPAQLSGQNNKPGSSRRRMTLRNGNGRILGENLPDHLFRTITHFRMRNNADGLDPHIGAGCESRANRRSGTGRKIDSSGIQAGDDSPREESLSTAFGEPMLRPHQTLANCLLWLAMTLAPLQGWQGTPVLCHLGCCLRCPQPDSAERSQDTAVPCCCRRAPTSPRHCAEASSAGLADAGRQSPCQGRCPKDCWCRRNAEICSEIRVAEFPIEFVATSDVIETSELDVRHHAGHNPSHRLSAATARQRCAVLCCFLT